MLKTIHLILAASSLMLAGCDTAPQQNDAAKTGASVMSETALLSHITTLSSDAFGGRAPNTEGEELTVNYLVDAFKDMGVAPANGDSYVQAVPLISIEAAPSASLVITDAKGAKTSLVYLDEMVVGSRQMKEHIAVSDSDLVFVGYGINAPERGWNDYAGLDVTGKTVVIMVNDPGFATQDPALFGGNAMTYYGRWTYKYDEAARQGAAGAIIIHETAPASYPWGVVKNGWSGKQFGIERADGGASLAAFEGWITNDVAADLFAKAGLDYAALKKAAETPGFKAVPMGFTASVAIDNEIMRTSSRNVAGIIKGSETPDEVFIYMAHWDHLGFDPSIDGDGIYNGAFDNATGTGALLELAKAFSSLEEKPKRSILFLAVAAEEQGLLGSAYYGANPLYPLNKTVAGLNMDGLNIFGPTKDLVIVGYGNSELDDYMGKVATSSDRVLAPDPSPEKGSFYRSDHFSLAKYGVPMLYARHGVDHIEKGREYGLKKAKEYTANDYHQPSDEVRDDWVLGGAIADMTMYYGLGMMVADSALWPAWHESSGFKAIREAQLNQK